LTGETELRREHRHRFHQVFAEGQRSVEMMRPREVERTTQKVVGGGRHHSVARCLVVEGVGALTKNLLAGSEHHVDEGNQ
jgi:hypothetical protein